MIIIPDSKTTKHEENFENAILESLKKYGDGDRSRERYNFTKILENYR